VPPSKTGAEPAPAEVVADDTVAPEPVPPDGSTPECTVPPAPEYAALPASTLPLVTAPTLPIPVPARPVSAGVPGIVGVAAVAESAPMKVSGPAESPRPRSVTAASSPPESPVATRYVGTCGVILSSNDPNPLLLLSTYSLN